MSSDSNISTEKKLVLFELAKGMVTGGTAELGRTEHLSEAERERADGVSDPVK